jgi:hypothetical protein
LRGEENMEGEERKIERPIYQDNSGGIQVRIYEGRKPAVT